MTRRPGWWALTAALAAIAAAVLGLVTSTDPDPGHRESTGRATESKSPDPRSAGRRGGSREVRPPVVRRQVRRAVAESKPARLNARTRRVADVVRAYVTALDEHRGAGVCRELGPGALSGVDLPRRRGDCARSLDASIGYRDPRGFPVYAGSRIARIVDVEISGQTARVTATTVTRFAGGREPSIEDDVVYLRRFGGEWRIVKPSAALYRAIGAGEIPPRALAPP